jgi:hypothetical protein
MSINSGRERNVNYMIRESKYITGYRYHNAYDKMDCSIENAKYYTEFAPRMSKDERIAASSWSMRCLFDRMLKRDEYMRKLRQDDERQVFDFLKHEHVLRLFINCSSALRDWDSKWTSTLLYMSGMLVSFPDSSFRAVQNMSKNRDDRKFIVSQVKLIRSREIYKYLIKRLRNAISNRKPLSNAFVELAGPVQPVVSNLHRRMMRNEKRVIINSRERNTKKKPM